ncbi:MAG: paraquat-inducible protein A [Myxococcota bacterium]
MSGTGDGHRFPAGTAAAAGLATCHLCYKLAPASLHACPRCGAAIHLRGKDSLQRTMALVATALLLYIPANILPIMTTTQLGTPEPSTILGGVVILIHHGSYPIAAVIFIASVLVPTGKLIAITWLCWSVRRGQRTSHQQRTVMYRVTEFVGKWSMTDVFVVAILVALIQLGGLLTITAGTAAIAFGGVVIVTMLAAESFDPRLIWDHSDDPEELDDQLETDGAHPAGIGGGP